MLMFEALQYEILSVKKKSRGFVAAECVLHQKAYETQVNFMRKLHEQYKYRSAAHLACRTWKLSAALKLVSLKV